MRNIFFIAWGISGVSQIIIVLFLIILGEVVEFYIMYIMFTCCNMFDYVLGCNDCSVTILLWIHITSVNVNN